MKNPPLHHLTVMEDSFFINFLGNTFGCILNPGHGKIPAPDFYFYMQKDKYPI